MLNRDELGGGYLAQLRPADSADAVDCNQWIAPGGDRIALEERFRRASSSHGARAH